jgi:hypothetical protein
MKFKKSVEKPGKLATISFSTIALCFEVSFRKQIHGVAPDMEKICDEIKGNMMGVICSMHMRDEKYVSAASVQT